MWEATRCRGLMAWEICRYSRERHVELMSFHLPSFTSCQIRFTSNCIDCASNVCLTQAHLMRPCKGEFGNGVEAHQTKKWHTSATDAMDTRTTTKPMRETPRNKTDTSLQSRYKEARDEAMSPPEGNKMSPRQENARFKIPILRGDLRSSSADCSPQFGMLLAVGQGIASWWPSG